MIVEGENVSHFQKIGGDIMRAPTGPSNAFQILNQLHKQQQAVDQSKNPVQSSSFKTTTPSESASKLMMMAMGIPRNNSSSAHVHKLPKQVLKSGDSVTLQEDKTPHKIGLL